MPRIALEGDLAAPRVPLNALLSVVAAAWAVVGLLDLTGAASSFHHDHLAHSGLSPWAAVLVQLPVWQVMNTAMMLPSSLRTIRRFHAVTEGAERLVALRWLFLGAFFVIWTGFDVVAFLGDLGLHHVVDGSPWLTAHAGLVPAATLGIAAAYQFTPLKHARLEACRRPEHVVRGCPPHGVASSMVGFRHGLDCLGSCWGLMLLMFAAGPGHLAWMAGIAGLVVVEKEARSGHRVARLAGAALAVLAAVVLFDPSVAVIV